MDACASPLVDEANNASRPPDIPSILTDLFCARYEAQLASAFLILMPAELPVFR